MADLVTAFRRHVERAGLFRVKGTAVIAVSGGPDSVALFDLLRSAAGDLALELVVAHADHGIHPGSGTVARTVHDLAVSWGVPFELGELRLGAAASETVARRARYDWLRDTQRRHAARFLVTAHHSDDQVETILLRVLRGSAPAGLAGMPARGREGLVRPLLPFERADLVAHVRRRGLPSHEDPANRDPRHLRSWVRGGLVPVLVERLGTRVLEDLLRLGRHAAADRRAWDGVLELLPDLELRATKSGFDVARDCLARYDDPVAAALLRAAARRVRLVLGPRRAGAVVRLARGQSGRVVELGAGWAAEAAFERLRVVRRAGAVAVPVVAGGRRGAARFGDFRVEWRPERAPERLERGGWTTWITDGDWGLRPPARGDRMVPLRGVGRREVRRLLRDARVPRADRAVWPLVARGDTVLWVPGVCRGADALPRAGTEALRVDVVRNDGG